jgi:TRL-like protein family
MPWHQFLFVGLCLMRYFRFLLSLARNRSLTCGILTCALFSGCVFTKIKVPLDTDVWQTKLGQKVGVSSTYSLLWLVAWGDGGSKKAAENGGISVIQHMDRGVESYFFGLYSRQDTIVYGD